MAGLVLLYSSVRLFSGLELTLLVVELYGCLDLAAADELELTLLEVEDLATPAVAAVPEE